MKQTIKTAFLLLAAGLAIIPAQAHAGGFNTLFSNLGAQITGASGFLVLFMGFCGGCAVAWGLFKAWKMSDDNSRVSPKEVFIPLVVGGLMLSFSVVVTMSSESVGGGARTATPAAQNLSF